MPTLTISPTPAFHGTLDLPGDKSISHRALFLAALAEGTSVIDNLNGGADVATTLAALRSLGVRIEVDASRVRVYGEGLAGFRLPRDPIDCGNSGTTARLLMGLLAGFPGTVVLDGDASLRRRPMKRLAVLLREMGGWIETPNEGLPVTIRGTRLHPPASIATPVPSAQLKSALLLAGLVAGSRLKVREPAPTRDHTERLIAWLGGKPKPFDLRIPGDPSAAAFWIAAATLAPRWSLTLPDVGLNPTRAAFWRLVQPGGRLEVAETPGSPSGPEPVGTLKIGHSTPRPFSIDADAIPGLIDELPLVALLATQAEGMSTVSGAGELRVKESDRLTTTADLLNGLGAQIEVTADGWRIVGPTPLHGGSIDHQGDHRLAMLGCIAGLIASGPVAIPDAEVMAVSDPTFIDNLRHIGCFGLASS